MEDAATAEISRSQLWQWIHHPEARLNDGRRIDSPLYGELADQEMAKLKGKVDDQKIDEARHLLDQLVLGQPVLRISYINRLQTIEGKLIDFTKEDIQR